MSFSKGDGPVGRSMNRFHSQRRVRTTVLTILLMTGMAALGTTSPDAQAQYDPLFSQACGPVNLYLGMRLLGIDASFENVFESCDIDGNGQASLASLERTAQEHGLFTKSVKANMRMVQRLHDLAILHVVRPKDHFLLFAGRVNGKLRMLDGTRKKSPSLMVLMEPAKIRRIWDGNMLVISRTPVQLPETGRTGRTIQAGLGCGIIMGLAFVLLQRRRKASCRADCLAAQ